MSGELPQPTLQSILWSHDPVGRCKGAAGDHWKSGFASSKTGPDVTVGSMAAHEESEGHGVQTDWCGLMRVSVVSREIGLLQGVRSPRKQISKLSNWHFPKNT